MELAPPGARHLPPPPADLGDRPLPLATRAHAWWRLHDGRFGPVWFGRGQLYRFDDPQGEFGVLYVTRTVEGAFAEAFRVGGRRALTIADLRRRHLARVEFARPLRLVDLTGPGLARIGVDAALVTAPWRDAQRWSRAIWAHPACPDGLLYPSGADPSCVCAAVFDRAAGGAVATSHGPLTEDLARLGALLDRYDVALLD